MKMFVLSLCIGLATLAHAKDASDSGALLPPHAQYLPVRGSRIHLGMAAAEVLRVMGDGPQSNTSGDTDLQVLNFPAEPIPTKVVLTGGKVSSISLDIARLDNVRLPEFTRKALPGMSSEGVRFMLGAPTDARHYEYFGIKLDQLIFERADDPTASVFFVKDRVVTKTAGTAVPADIFRVVLPAPPDPAVSNTAEEGAVVGAPASDLQTLIGTPKLRVDYSFNGQPAAHALYQTRDHHTLSVYFVGGVLTEIEDSGTWSLDDISAG